MEKSSVCCSRGFGQQPSCLQPQDQVLRNHKVGSKCSGAESGPRLLAVTRMAISLGDCLAYSISTSKYRFSSNTPVSASSNSRSNLLRRPFSLTRCSYGNSTCGYL